MKFCKIYENYMKQVGKTLPGIGYRRLKKDINKCRSHIQSCNDALSTVDCSAVVDCFLEEAQKLLDSPSLCLLGNWIYSCFDCSRNGVKYHNDVLIKEGQELLIYAIVNAIAFRKILKKYDKVHKCEKGREFKSDAQVKHVDILQSPWFYELMSSQINLRDKKLKAASGDVSLLEGLALTFNNDKPSMSCGLFHNFKIDVDLICPICLDIVFDAVALTCGHILCYTCACSTASVTIVDGLKAAAPRQKCPLCRQDVSINLPDRFNIKIEGENVLPLSLWECMSGVHCKDGVEARVYNDAIRLEELNILLSRRCPEYWEKRLETERSERLRLVKEHWQAQLHGLVS
ncbi:probable E3 ubiquitin-protein ligase BAH1-like 1 isoform X2 [Beta vulgaris subsp. vulgaris]|uniref:probable E3 ubiquitin-protein ligase BAH1-like 1 isoform X2 n=1 Tax=Beta vulgaris subsp. vulgaris TaxID=3555 RepID=UPI002036CC2A|nr:probable E3 ubiquitin-protein ligase BAH1-like 1 isoform X2 [Beta vulgaris subsp. vulgaris]